MHIAIAVDGVVEESRKGHDADANAGRFHLGWKLDDGQVGCGR